MRVKTWKIFDYGDVPEGSPAVEITCDCGYTAECPVRGRLLAQVGMGFVFDNTGGAIPRTIKCRKCRRIYTTED